tara:strand:- start:146 stop:988 length:843 start_codon:yes stop_codon:yes gene_type:complete
MKNRASSSNHASSYKLQGHRDEYEFSLLLDGDIVSGTGKADFIDKDKKSYSIKGGAKKWQIFLYSRNRFLNDVDFQSDNLGKLFIGSLDCFPDDYSTYKSHKEEAKKKLLSYFEIYGNKPKDEKEYIDLIGTNNTYLNAKLGLFDANKEIKQYLSESSNLKKFLQKSIFDNNEVDFWAIKKDSDFLIYDSKEAISILADLLTPKLSQKINGRPDDINLAGQKVLLKHNTNICELEVRNDSEKHYRQIRFNMYRAKVLDILNENFTLTGVQKENIKFFSKK